VSAFLELGLLFARLLRRSGTLESLSWWPW
jgi:hypothetical protein